MAINIDKAALRRIQRKLKTVSEFNRRASEPMEESVEILRDALADYPRKSPGAFSRLATPGQRRAYWARVKSGDITHRDGVGYVRSGKTGQRWTTRIIRSAGKQITGAYGIRGVVGNNAPWAKWVQRAGDQQPFHVVSGWITDKRAVRENSDDINRIWARWIRRELNK